MGVGRWVMCVCVCVCACFGLGWAKACGLKVVATLPLPHLLALCGVVLCIVLIVDVLMFCLPVVLPWLGSMG